MLNLVLVEPEIPENCGNIARTCVVTGSRLHLVKPLGFDISDAAVRRHMKRCGLDYWPRLELQVYESLEEFLALRGGEELWLATTKAPLRYDRAAYTPECYLVFGKESAGLPQWLRERYRERCVRIPMRPGERSLNLSNSVAVAAYEALRQTDFPDLLDYGEMRDQTRDR